MSRNVTIWRYGTIVISLRDIRARLDSIRLSRPRFQDAREGEGDKAIAVISWPCTAFVLGQMPEPWSLQGESVRL